MVSTILNRGQIHSNIKELLASTYADMIAVSTVQLAPGSKCLCLDSFVEYILSPEMTWVEIPVQGNGGNIVVPDLDRYATVEYVDERIAFLINNESVDLDSIMELAKVLEEGGADLVEIRQAIEEIIKALAEKCSIKEFEEFEANVLAKEQELSQGIASETERAIAAEIELKNFFEGKINVVDGEIDEVALLANETSNNLFILKHQLADSINDEAARATEAESALSADIAAVNTRIDELPVAIPPIIQHASIKLNQESGALVHNDNIRVIIGEMKL